MKLTGLILTYNCEALVQKAIDKIPKNVFVVVISPINRVSYFVTSYKQSFVKSILSLQKKLEKSKGLLNLYDVINDLLSVRYFLDSHIFLPNQIMYDIELSYSEEEVRSSYYCNDIGVYDFNDPKIKTLELSNNTSIKVSNTDFLCMGNKTIPHTISSVISEKIKKQS